MTHVEVEEGEGCERDDDALLVDVVGEEKKGERGDVHREQQRFQRGLAPAAQNGGEAHGSRREGRRQGCRLPPQNNDVGFSW